jgi:hypothetical protein
LVHNGHVSFCNSALTVTSICKLTLALAALILNVYQLALVRQEGIVVMKLDLHRRCHGHLP